MSGSRENLEGVNNLSDEERRIERLLAELAPRESRLSRDRTMFRAGQASGQSPPTVPRAKRWIWPAVTVCSTAAGLLAGVLVTTPSRPAASVVRRSPDDALDRQPAIAPENSKVDAETVVADSRALLELRIALARRVGDEFTLAQSDVSASDARPTASAPSGADAFAPLTYGDALGQLRGGADKKDL
jgi:hypothetical protein